MNTRANRIAMFVAPAMLTGVAVRPAPAQVASTTEEYDLAVVTGDDVYVRSGPGDSYYPFGRLSAGAVVKVVGEKYNWSRIVTEGPAFYEYFGYIREQKADAGLFRIDEEGRCGRTLGPMDLLAPNLNTDYNPGDSWKRILELDAEVDLTVIETIDTERDIVWKVELPTEAEGWISATFLEPATAAQTEAWMRQVSGVVPRTPDATAAAATLRTAAEDAVAGEEVVPAGAEAGTLAAPVGVIEPFFDPDEYPTLESADDAAIDATTTTPTSMERRESIDARSTTLRGPSEPWTRVLDAVDFDDPSMNPRAVFQDLEAAYQRLRNEPIETAEVLPLRQLYLNLAQGSRRDEVVARYAAARAEQLGIWADLQKRRAEIDRLRLRAEMTTTEAEAVRIAIQATGSYVGVGRLSPSMIYRGGRLPQLYRLQDPATGRTIAYLAADSGFDLAGMLGQIIGVAGETRFDAGLRLNLIEPVRIDLLAPTG